MFHARQTLTIALMAIFSASVHASKTVIPKEFHGTWTTNPTQQECMGGPESPALIISGTRVEGGEIFCTAHKSKIKSGLLSVSLKCRSEGERFNRVIMMRLAGNKIKWQYEDRNNEPMHLYDKCKN